MNKKQTLAMLLAGAMLLPANAFAASADDFSDFPSDCSAAGLRRAVSSLSARERRIMELRFGLLDGVERTQKEVADAIGISQSYISRLEKRIIRQLREQLGE